MYGNVPGLYIPCIQIRPGYTQLFSWLATTKGNTLAAFPAADLGFVVQSICVGESIAYSREGSHCSIQWKDLQLLCSLNVVHTVYTSRQHL